MTLSSFVKQTFAAILLFGFPVSVFSQARFPVPKEITEFDLYTRIDQCNALRERMSDQATQGKDSLSFRKELFQDEVSEDTTSVEVRSAVKSCIAKFTPDDLRRDDSLVKGESLDAKMMGLYLVAGEGEKFREKVSSVLAPFAKDSSYEKLFSAFQDYVRNPLGKSSPMDYALLDSLVDVYLKPENDSDPKWAADYLGALKQRIDRRYDTEREAALREYTNLLQHIDSMLQLTSAPDTVLEMRAKGIKLDMLNRLRREETLDSLSAKGWAGYYKELQRNSHDAGLTKPLKLSNPIGRRMTSFDAFIAFRKDGSVWRSASSIEGTPDNEMYRIATGGKPHLLVFLDALCRDDAGITGSVKRKYSVGTCWSTYEYIRWFASTYPEIDITVATWTVGHFNELPLPNPYDEADLIQKSWSGFHKLPVNIVISYTDHFSMPPLDSRRVDLPKESMFAVLDSLFPDRSPSKTPSFSRTGFLFDEEGRIIASLSTGVKAVKTTREFVDPYLKWYRKTLSANRTNDE